MKNQTEQTQGNKKRNLRNNLEVEVLLSRVSEKIIKNNPGISFEKLSKIDSIIEMYHEYYFEMMFAKFERLEENLYGDHYLKTKIMVGNIGETKYGIRPTYAFDYEVGFELRWWLLTHKKLTFVPDKKILKRLNEFVHSPKYNLLKIYYENSITGKANCRSRNSKSRPVEPECEHEDLVT